MKLVTTFHQPSAVHASTKCRLSSRDLEHLVVAKSNRLEVFSLQPEGLRLECVLEIWGRILAIRALPIQKSARSNLVCLLDHPTPELLFLSYSESPSGAGSLSVKKALSLSERLPRPAEFFNDLVLNPSGTVLIVSCYVGRLKVVILENSTYSRDFDVTLPELSVFSITFLETPQSRNPTVAILHVDHQERLMLLARELSIEGLELLPEPSSLVPRTILSPNQFPTAPFHNPKLLSVPSLKDDSGEEEKPVFNGGVLVVGGRRLELYEFSNLEWQEKAKGKAKRLEKKKRSKDPALVAEAREKEKAREGKKRKPRAAVEWPWSDVSCVCEIDAPNQYLIADSYGRLAMLSFGFLDRLGLVLLPLGEVSPPTTLTYLTSQVLFVGSYLGDSQLIHVSPTSLSQRGVVALPIPPYIATASPSVLVPGVSTESDGKGKKRALDGESRSRRDVDVDVDMDFDSEEREIQAKKEAAEKGCIIANTDTYLKVVDVWQNIAPVNDATLVDLDGNGQKQVITCSGGKSSGSINVVRNGADFRELASISGIENIIGVWPLRPRFESVEISHIVISTAFSTHIFEFSNNSLQSVTQVGDGFVTSERTLATSNVAGRIKTPSGTSSYGDSSHIIQATSQSVYLLDYDDDLGQWRRKDRMKFPREIVAADINPSQVFVALQGGKINIVNVTPNGTLNSIERETQIAERDVSAICGMPLTGNKFVTKYIAVAYWQDNSVEVYQITPGQLELLSKTPPLPSAIHSIVLHNFGSAPSGEDYHPYLLAGLGDGTVNIYSWGDKGRALTDKKVVSLGLSPVSLSLCDVDGQPSVFAAGSQATVIGWDGRRLRSSPVMLKNVFAASRFHTPGYRSCLILAVQTGLVIGMVKDLNKLHIHSIPLGVDVPRKIIHDSSMKVLGVICTHTAPVRIGEAEMPTSSFKLLDEVTYQSICEFACGPTEELTAAVKMRQITDGKIMSIYCLGSLRYHPAEIEASGGRLIALTASHEQSKLQISVLAAAEVQGCVYAIAVVGDLIAAAVNSSVMLYKLEEESEATSVPSYTLKKLDEWNHNYFVTSLSAFDNQLLLGDHLTSISLLRVEGEKLRLLTKEYAPLWPVSVESSSTDTIIGSNDTNNIFSYIVVRSPRRIELKREGLFYTGELITKFMRGPLLTPDTSNAIAIKPEYVYATATGRIGVIVDVTDDHLASHLASLQRNLAYLRKGPGEATLAQYRAPKNSRGVSDGEASYGFLDGDFLEHFLSHLSSLEDVQQIVEGTKPTEELRVSKEELKRTLEALQAMH